MRSRLFFLLLLLVFSFPFLRTAEAAPGMGFAPPVVTLGKVEERFLRNRLTAVGTVAPYRTSVVSSEIEGLVKSAPLREGDRVVVGRTVLATLTRTDLDHSLKVLEAELAKARQDYLRLRRGTRKEEIEAMEARLREREARRRLDERELKRAEDLLTKKIIDQATYDRALSSYEGSQGQFREVERNLRLLKIGPREEEIAAAAAEVARGKARISQVRDELSKAVIRSPLTGFLTEKHVEVGQWVQKGGRIAEVIELGRVLVRVPISEKRIAQVREGGSVDLRFDAIPERPFAGRVRNVIPKADTKSRTFPVEIELTNTSDFAVKAGMFARVSMEYGERFRAVLVPKDAVLQRGRGDSAVFVFEKGQVREVVFPTGQMTDSFMQVPSERLRPGTQVVVHGNENLRSGMPVQVRGTGGPPAGAGAQGRGPSPSGQDRGGRRR